MHYLQTVAHGFFYPLARSMDFLGDNGFAFLTLGIALVIKTNTRECGIAVLLAIIIGALVTNVWIKPLVARPRPYAIGDEDYTNWWTAAGCMTESDMSFPSGHTTVTMTTVTVLFWMGDKCFSWLYFFPALIMGFTRCYLMIHYPSDVAGALIVGFLTGSLAAYLGFLM